MIFWYLDICPKNEAISVFPKTFLCFRIIVKGELGELQIYIRKIPLHQQKFLAVLVLGS